MKLLEARGTEAMVMIGELFDPISNIAMDTKLVKCIQTKQFFKAFKFALTEHPEDLRQMLAICNGVKLEEYNKTAGEMLNDLMEMVNDPYVQKLFFSQAQETDNASFGSAMETLGAAM